MKYYLISWTAETEDGESFSGNATMQLKEENPSDEFIIDSLKSANAKLKDLRISLQDKLGFDTQEELDHYGNSFR